MIVDLTSVVFQDGKFWVSQCVELGVISQGASRVEALSNLQEAVELFLEDTPEFVPSKSEIQKFTVSYA